MAIFGKLLKKVMEKNPKASLWAINPKETIEVKDPEAPVSAITQPGTMIQVLMLSDTGSKPTTAHEIFYTATRLLEEVRLVVEAEAENDKYLSLELGDFDNFLSRKAGRHLLLHMPWDGHYLDETSFLGPWRRILPITAESAARDPEKNILPLTEEVLEEIYDTSEMGTDSLDQLIEPMISAAIQEALGYICPPPLPLNW